MTLLPVTVRLATVALVGVLGLVLVQNPRATHSQTQDRPAPMMRELTIRASGCAFNPNLIEAWQGDRLRLTLVAEDGIYAFALDEYRLSKQFSPGRNAIVEFLADRPGSFVFYNSLTRDTRCTGMRGELIVH
jgi:heme/copper-type cytochrome/quinol oxidase subunit 2